MKTIKENSLGEVYIQKINHGNKTKAKNKAKEVAKQFEERLNTPREERKNVNSSSELIEVDPTSNMLYGDYLLKKWLPFVKNSLEVTSYSGYENKTKIIAKYFNNLGITLNNLTKSDIKKFYTYLQETRHIKNKTVNRYHANIHKSLEDAITEFELIEVNPAKLIRPDRVTRHFGDLIKNNNLRKIELRQLRHSCATLLLANGVPLDQIQVWLRTQRH